MTDNLRCVPKLLLDRYRTGLTWKVFCCSLPTKNNMSFNWFQSYNKIVSKGCVGGLNTATKIFVHAFHKLRWTEICLVASQNIQDEIKSILLVGRASKQNVWHLIFFLLSHEFGAHKNLAFFWVFLVCQDLKDFTIIKGDRGRNCRNLVVKSSKMIRFFIRKNWHILGDPSIKN